MTETKVYIFGSYYNKLYLPNSDVDIVMICPEKEIMDLLLRADKIIRRQNDLFIDIETI